MGIEMTGDEEEQVHDWISGLTTRFEQAAEENRRRTELHAEQEITQLRDSPFSMEPRSPGDSHFLLG